MRRVICTLLTLAMVLSLLSSPALALNFPDVDENEEYADAIAYISDLGIMVGDEKGNFNPEKPVTRAEMATLICRLVSAETDTVPDTATFTDVPANHWAYKNVETTASLGIINGYGNGKFGPSDTVTYEQAIAMIVRALGGMYEADIAGGYPEGYIKVADESGLLQGVELQEREPMSRANISILIYNACTY